MVARIIVSGTVTGIISATAAGMVAGIIVAVAATRWRAIVAVVGGNHVDPTVETVSFAVGTGGEKQGVGRLVRDAVAETQAPESINSHGLTVGPLELAPKLTASEIVGIDGAVPEIADQLSLIHI